MGGRGGELTLRVSESHTVAEKPPTHGAKRRVTDVLDEDVLRVLDRHGSHLISCYSGVQLHVRLSMFKRLFSGGRNRPTS